MKKSILAIATMAALIAGAADTDSYLYWMVNVDEDGWNYAYSATVKGCTDAKGQGEGTYLNLYWVDGGDPITSTGMGAPAAASSSVGRTDLQTLKDTGWGFYAGLASNPTYGSYVIELWGDSGNQIGNWTIDAAEAMAYIAQNGIGVPATAAWAVPATLPIPEPTSGMLLLLGVAGLALRRRKMRVA